MSPRLFLTATATVVATMSWQATFAQTAAAASDAGVSRAQRKAETAAANKAGKLTPAGEAENPIVRQPSTGSTVSRAQRKADTAAANKAGQLTPAGEGPQPTAPTGKSTVSRAQRKADTAAANRAGQLTPAGEGGGMK